MLSRSDFKPYQDRLVQWQKDHPASGAWVFMGAGKTVSTLTAYDDLRQSFDARRMLVAAPLRVAQTVWSDEVETWEHLRHLKVVKILGTEKERLRALETPGDVYTINRENVQWLEEQFIYGKKQIRRWPFDTVVLDESQSYKSQSSKRWKSIRRLRRLTERFVELSGTPSPNGLGDVWAQVWLLDRGQRLGMTETAFRERWFNPPGYEDYRWTIKPHAEKEIYERVGDIVLSLREEDYFDLEPVVPTLVKVPLSPAVLDKYRRFERTYVLDTFAGQRVTAVSAGVCVGKKMQLANGAIYLDDTGRYEVFHDGKIAALVELLEGLDEPVIVVYNFQHDLARIRAALGKAFGKTRRVKRLDSQETVREWNRGDVDILLLHPESAGHGLNLQGSGCEHIIWFGLTYNLEHIQQVFARLGGGHRRAGRTLVVSYIVAEGTIDAEVTATTDGKALTQERLIEGVAEVNARVEREMLGRIQ